MSPYLGLIYCSGGSWSSSLVFLINQLLNPLGMLCVLWKSCTHAAWLAVLASRWPFNNKERKWRRKHMQIIRFIEKWKCLSRVRLFVIPWTVAHQAHPWNSPGKHTGVGCHFLLQGIFRTQGSNPGLPHCRRTLYRLSHQGTHVQCFSIKKIGEFSLAFSIPTPLSACII